MPWGGEVYTLDSGHVYKCPKVKGDAAQRLSGESKTRFDSFDRHTSPIKSRTSVEY